MASDGFDWIQNAALGWPAVTPPRNKIDTHHHCVPGFYAEAVEKPGGDPSGWPTPKWTPHASERIMTRMGIQTTILSITAPGACIMEGKASHDLARKCNEYASSLRDTDPTKWGFFATLPSLQDTQAALDRIACALDVLRADGVTLFTRYGRCYLGPTSLEPIWAELHRRKAVVFVHPTYPVDTTRINEKMAAPMIDFAHETSRAAMDMITMGTRSKFPDCKVILSHAGGTLPYLISRVATTLSKAPDLAAKWTLGTTHGQVMWDFRSFYYDLALSSSPAVLRMMLELVPQIRFSLVYVGWTVETMLGVGS